MPVGRRADPHLLPRWRDDQQFAALDIFRGEAVAELIEVDESLTGASPGPSRISG